MTPRPSATIPEQHLNLPYAAVRRAVGNALPGIGPERMLRSEGVPGVAPGTREFSTPMGTHDTVRIRLRPDVEAHDRCFLTTEVSTTDTRNDAASLRRDAVSIHERVIEAAQDLQRTPGEPAL